MDFGSIEQYLKENWLLIGGLSALNLVLVYAKVVKGGLATMWTVGGITGLLSAAYGFMLSNNIKSGYTYYHDGYYYFG